MKKSHLNQLYLFKIQHIQKNINMRTLDFLHLFKELSWEH